MMELPSIEQPFDLPIVRFHDLRHTHATLLLLKGIHPKIVSERLGHKDILTTLQLYSHVLPSLQEEASHSIEDLLFESKTIKSSLFGL